MSSGKNSTPPTPPWVDPHVTFRTVVPEVDDVGAQDIPYLRIGGRSPKVYGSRYRTWADVADQKLSDLLTQRGAGVRTVEQLIDAARDAVAAYRMVQMRSDLPLEAAVQELLSRLHPLDRAVLAARVWAADPVPPEELDRKFGKYEGWTHRRVILARRRFKELLAEPIHRGVASRCSTLRWELGPYVPAVMVCERLRAMDVEPESETSRLLLFAAGPYKRLGDWWENRSLGGRRAVLADVEAVFAKNPAPRQRRLEAAVSAHHMPAEVVPALMDSLPVRRFGAVYVQWGATPAAKIGAFLHAKGRPLTPEDVAAGIGDEFLTAEKVRDAFINNQNDRFSRASKTTWGLTEWGAPPYRGIAEAIRERIAAGGGSARVDDVAADVVHSYPDISPKSVSAYMQSLAFVVEDGIIRQRTDTDPLPRVRHWRRTRGVFTAGVGTLNVLRPVTADLLRGTSSPAGRLAGAVGVAPGGRETFTGPGGIAVTVSWLLDAPGAPHIGSLRRFAQSVGAVEGDSIILSFSPVQRSVAVARVPAGTPVLELLQRVTGRRPVTRAAVAESLECTPAEVVDVLIDRGDEALGAAVAGLRR